MAQWNIGMCVQCGERPQLSDDTMCSGCLNLEYALAQPPPLPKRKQQEGPPRNKKKLPVIPPCPGCGMVGQHAAECRTFRVKKDEFEIPRTRTERKQPTPTPPPMPKDELLSPAEIKRLQACCDPFLGISTQMKRVIPVGVTATVLIAIASFFLVTGVVRARATEPKSAETSMSFTADDLDTADLTSR